MSDDERQKKPLTGEVLPPLRSDAQLPIHPPRGGASFFNRLHYEATRKELVVYGEMLAAQNADMRLINEALRLREEFNAGLIRTERWSDLRKTVGLKIDTELDAALTKFKTQQEVADNEALKRRGDKAILLARAREAEAYLASLDAPTPVPAPQPTDAERIASEIARLKATEHQLIAVFMQNFESEEDVPEEDREHITNIRFATRDRICRLLE